MQELFLKIATFVFTHKKMEKLCAQRTGQAQNKKPRGMFWSVLRGFLAEIQVFS